MAEAAAPERKTYIPEQLCAITPNTHTQPYWDACKKRELRMPRCARCGEFRFPPFPGCRHCGCVDVEWVKVSGGGTVYTYTVAYHPVVPFLAEAVPYNIAAIDLDGAPGARMISNVVDAPPDGLWVGMKVQVVWEEVSPDIVLPRFRRA